MTDQGDIISVSWGDHVEWGEGEALLDTPEQVAAGVRRWKTHYGAKKILWRGSNWLTKQYTRTFTRAGAATSCYCRMVYDRAHPYELGGE